MISLRPSVVHWLWLQFSNASSIFSRAGTHGWALSASFTKADQFLFGYYMHVLRDLSYMISVFCNIKNIFNSDGA
ncbi:hypothetical protein B0H11DRAFT_2035903 [Mycena galericulata]|nr:hypothetical protein B0H11DRAFT_2035903 [Mycena galericulata]